MKNEQYYKDKAKQYLEEGYCVLENILAPQLLKRFRQLCESHLQNTPSTHRDQQRSTGSLIDISNIPELAELVANPTALQEFEKMGFGDVRFTTGYLISKPPQSPPLFWHFDWMGWAHPASYTKTPLQTFFMYYLVDTNVNNGCLKVIPRSHLEEHSLHDKMRNAHTEELREANNLDADEFQSHPDEVNVCVKAGDLVIGDSRIIHGSHPNNSDAERPVITIWMHPEFSSLPEELQAFCGNQDHSEWPEAYQKVLAPLKPTYSGSATATPRSRHRPKAKK